MVLKPYMGPAVQDMPPEAGFARFPVGERNSRPRGPSGFLILGTIFGMTVYGFYKISIQNTHSRAIRKEMKDARMAIQPYILADTQLKEHIAFAISDVREAEIMKDVPEWKVGSVYSNRWRRNKYYKIGKEDAMRTAVRQYYDWPHLHH